MKTLLIRTEDKNRWERRAPLVPEDLREIIKETGGKALVEKSEKRILAEELYGVAGAVSCVGMAEGDVILGVKGIPVEKILDIFKEGVKETPLGLTVNGTAGVVMATQNF